MESVARTIRQLAAFVVVVAGILVPSTEGLLPVGVVLAVVALAVVSMAWSFVVVSASSAEVRVRSLLHRLVPTASQSDPDARGHARPRAPSRLLTAV